MKIELQKFNRKFVLIARVLKHDSLVKHCKRLWRCASEKYLIHPKHLNENKVFQMRPTNEFTGGL